MAGKIQTMIPQYGELNRIYRDYIDNHSFSFGRQKYISDFYQEYNDMKAFEAAILELVLDRQKEQYTLILNSLKTEIEKSMQAYEKLPLSDRAIKRVCYQHMERYSREIEAQLDVTRRLSKPLNEANNRYDSIGYREHTAEEEKQAEKEYERCKAEYDREKAKLNKLYDQQKATRTEALQYMKNCCADIYRQSCLFWDILKKYIPDGKQEDEPDKPISQQETTEEQQEYFSMKLLSLIHEVSAEEQFEEISAPDFYANMNLHPCNCKLKIKPREKIRVCYLIFLMSRYLLFKSRNKWTESQKKRAKILFELYPDIENAYNLTDELRRIYSSTKIKGVAYTKLAHWYKHVEDAGYDSFQVVKQTIYENYIDILNFFDNRSTNTSAESFNAKIKNFRAQLRGISDVKYFLFRLQKIYA